MSITKKSIKIVDLTNLLGIKIIIPLVGLFLYDSVYFGHADWDQLSLVRRLFAPEGRGVKKVPFHFTIKLPKPLKERVIVERDDKGRIVHSSVPQRVDRKQSMD